MFADSLRSHPHRSVCLIIVVSAVISAGPSLQADSTLNFPRLSHDTDTVTGIAIVNPTDQDAVVTLTAYGTDGQMLAGVAQAVQVTVTANQQLSKLTTELFGDQLDPATVGWFQATSPVDGLTGFFLFLNSSATRFDGADLPSSAQSIIFNQARVDATHTTELNIINPGSVPAQLTLQLMDGESSPAAQSLSLAAMGVARLDVATFFGVGTTSASAYIRVDADLPVAGFEFIQDTAGDLLGLNAQDASAQLRNLFFPQMALLGGWKTELGLINYSSQAVIVTITAFRPDGELYDTNDLKNNPVTRSLTAGQSLVEDVETMFGFSGTETLDGWLKAESTADAINGFVSYGVPGSGSVAAVTASGNGQKLSIFSHIATASGFFTGVALLNSGQLATNVRVLAIQPSADVLGSFNTVLQPGERQSRLINEMISEAADQPGGLIWVKSDFPIHLSSLFGSGAILANIPPQLAPVDYQPDAGLPSVAVDPQLAILQPEAMETFQLTGAPGQVDWKVNGLSEGDETLGAISSEGVYTAPASVPDEAVITVTAESDGQVAGASIDLLEKEQLLSSSLIVQSVAYLESLSTLYTAELALLSGAGEGSRPLANRPAQEITNSEVFAVDSSGKKVSIAQFPGEKIVNMISFRASNGVDFLLLASQTGGTVLRLDPSTSQITQVGTDLNQPNSIVFDTISDTLLVAELDKISAIPRVQLELGLSPQARRRGPFRSPKKLDLFSVERADDVVVDNCTGNIFFSDRTKGEVLEYVLSKGTTRTVLSGLSEPTKLLSIFRSGISCPDAFHLLINEQGLDQVILSVPRRNFSRRWIDARQSTDLTFLPARSPFAKGGEAILLPEAAGGQQVQQGGGFELSAVPVRKNYKKRPVNRPPPPPPAADEPGPGGLDGTSVTMKLTSNMHFRGDCPEHITTVDVDFVVNAQGKVEEKGGSLTSKGTFSGGFGEACSTTGTVGDECTDIEDCSFQGDFVVDITPSDPTSLSGTWDMTLQGSERCVSDEGTHEEIFSFRVTFEVNQTGEQLSGSFLFSSVGELLDFDEPVICSQPGQCEIIDPIDGNCTLTCDPPTANCAPQFNLFGTATASGN